MDNFFQSDTFYEFLESLSFLEAFKVEVTRGGEVKGRIVGYIQKDGGRLKQFFSRRAIVNGGPMLSDDITEGEIEELLHRCVEKLRYKAIYIEFRNYADYSAYREAFEKCGFEYEPHLNFQVDTTDIEAMDERIGKHRRKYIRLTFRDGTEVIENPTLEQVGYFYRILEELYKTKVKTPLVPFEFFEKAYNRPEFFFPLVAYQGEIVGGACCLLQRDEKIYEWYLCGRDGVFRNIYPSSAAKYGAMKYACEHGYSMYDMMGAGKPGVSYGVRDFKAEFGGEMVEHGRYKYVCNKVLFNVGTVAVKILKLSR